MAGSVLCALGMVNFQALLNDTPLPDKRLRTRATLLFQSLLQGHTANSLGMLSPADRTQESFTRGAYRFFDHQDVTLPALHSPMQAALKQLVCPERRAYVAHDVWVLNYSGHERKEDLIPVGNDHTFGYELFQSLVIQGGRPLGAAVTELRHSHGLLSSQSTDILPFTDHLQQTERAIDAIEKLLPGCELVHLCDREFDDLQLLRHLAERPYVIRCKHLSRLVTVHGEQQSLRHCADRVKLRQAGEVVRRLEHSTQTYTLWVGQTVVTMKGKSLRGVARKQNQPKEGKALRVRVVVSELRQPGQEPLRWVLLTNLKDSALSVVEGYLQRWKIDTFHRECRHKRQKFARRAQPADSRRRGASAPRTLARSTAWTRSRTDWTDRRGRRLRVRAPRETRLQQAS